VGELRQSRDLAGEFREGVLYGGVEVILVECQAGEGEDLIRARVTVSSVVLSVVGQAHKKHQGNAPNEPPS